MCQVRPRGGTRAGAPSPRGQGHFLEAPATLPYGRAKPGDQESVDGAWPLAEASRVGWGPLWLRLGLELLLSLPVGYHSCLPHPCSCLGPQSLLQLRHPLPGPSVSGAWEGEPGPGSGLGSWVGDQCWDPTWGLP